MRTKLVLGASLALLFASCNTLQKISNTAKDVKEIGETIYDFKPKNQLQKKNKDFIAGNVSGYVSYHWKGVNFPYNQYDTLKFTVNQTNDLILWENTLKKTTYITPYKDRYIKSAFKPIWKPKTEEKVYLTKEWWINGKHKVTETMNINKKKFIKSTYKKIEY